MSRIKIVLPIPFWWKEKKEELLKIKDCYIKGTQPSLPMPMCVFSQGTVSVHICIPREKCITNIYGFNFSFLEETETSKPVIHIVDKISSAIWVSSGPKAPGITGKTAS